MNDRSFRETAPGREYGRDIAADRDYRTGPDYARSSAREYAAAGEDFDRPRRRSSPGRDHGGRGEEYRGSYWSDGRRTTDQRGGYDRDEDRGFLDRAGDEVRSWFGDEEAERRRARDRYYDERAAGDDHYHAWRRDRIAELDRDYDEYRRENAQRFASEFGSWRTERTGQRESLGRVNEHMEVLGSDGEHVGTVDKVRGDRIVLTKSDSDAGGHHHSIPSRWIESVTDKVTIRKTAAEAQAAWRDEDRSGALFGGSDYEERWAPGRNRAFSGTVG